MDKRVSIIIPCHNGEAFIDDSIRSVWIQDYPDIELIVVNDGSTDKSEEKILLWREDFRKRGWLLRCLCQENRGPGGAVDAALKAVTGEYLTLLDADDVFLPGSVGRRAAFLDEHPDLAGVRSNGWCVTGERRRLFVTDEAEKWDRDLFTALSFGRTNNWAGSYMIRTGILFDAYPQRHMDPSPFGQNLQLLLPVAYRRSFGFLDEPLMEYRIRAESHSRTEDPAARYEKECRNSSGWRDIYRGILSWLIGDSLERAYYLRTYDSVYYRAAMERAIAHRKKADGRRSYRLLKATGHRTMDDRIAYAAAFHQPWSYPLRAIRKIRLMLRRK